MSDELNQMPGNLNPDPNDNPAVRELLSKIENNDKNSFNDLRKSESSHNCLFI